MITASLNTGTVIRYLSRFEKEVNRSQEVALDMTAFDMRDAVVDEMRRVFDNPVPYTLNSLKVTKTRNHNMQASVWFKDPDRMEDHYLVPQVEGTERKLKGFERALWNNKFVPGKGVKLNQHGNISRGTFVQIKSALGRAELTAGYQANTTAKSAKRNPKPRDYVYLPKGSRRGALPPGIYQRVVVGKNITSKQRRSLTGIGTYQQGRRRIGILTGNGNFRIEQNVIRARGLRPILVAGKQHEPVKPLLKFYEVGKRVFNKQFKPHFLSELKKRLP